MKSEASFKVFYCGSALDSGKMDVRELAPALLAIGSLLEESNRVLNGKKASVSVRVKRFEDGSFGIDFSVVQTLYSQVKDLFTGDDVTAAINLLQIIGFTGPGLFWLIKKSKGKKPVKAKILESGNIELDFSEEKIEVKKQVFDLYRDLRVRKEIENTLKPLEKEGIDGFSIKEDSNIVENVEKGEAKYFVAPEAEEDKLHERESIATYSIHTLNFKEDNKWRLTDGTSTFFVTIKDEDFNRKVKDNLIAFSQGDLLTMKIKTTTWETKDGIRTEYEAVQVIEHKSAARQLRLPIE